MRDSILRVIDDLETRFETYFEAYDTSDGLNVYKDGTYKGKYLAYAYAINELKKVLDDHADTSDKRTTSDTEQTQ